MNYGTTFQNCYQLEHSQNHNILTDANLQVPIDEKVAKRRVFLTRKGISSAFLCGPKITNVP